MKRMVILVTVPIVLETWFKGQPKFLSSYYDVEIITSNGDNIKDIENFEGVKIKIVDFNRKINLLKDMKVLISLFFHFLKSKPSIVYTLTPKAGLLGMIASYFAQVPFRVHSVVGLPHLEAKGIKREVLLLTEKLTYLFSNHLYCNSLNLVKEINNLTQKKVKVIANGSVNGVDTQYFKDRYSEDEKGILRAKYDILKDDFVLIYVGRVVKDKGINELILVFEQLSEKYNNLKLLLVGDFESDLNPISYKSKQAIDTNKNIFHIKFQQDIRDYLAISSLFVLPSYREGLPNVLIEAGSFGLPLVATNINGCNEIIVDGDNGALVDAKDTKSLYVAIERFIVDEKYYSFIKSNSRKNIKDRYSQQYFYKKLHEEFENIEVKSCA